METSKGHKALNVKIVLCPFSYRKGEKSELRKTFWVKAGSCHGGKGKGP